MLQLYTIFLTVFVAFGGFMFGYDTGVINGVKDMHGFREEMNLTTATGNNTCTPDSQEENALLGLIVSLFSLGCFIGALFAGGVSDFAGRKLTIIGGGVVFLLGGIVQTASLNLWMILAGRLVAGVGVGVLSMIVPVYNAEVAPKHLRGRLVSLNQLLITAGIMVSFIASLAVKDIDYGWRIALGLQCLLGATLIIGMIFLPETPRWLVKKGNVTKARKVLKSLRQGVDQSKVDEELTDIECAVKDTKIFSIKEILRSLLQWKVIQRIMIGMALQIFQQLTGINVIMYYSTTVFGCINVTNYVGTAIVGTVNFLTTLIAIFLIDHIGRKSLLLIGGIGMFLSILLAGLLLQFFDIENGGNDTVGYISAVLIVFFVFFFAFSWGPVVWVVTSEIFPLTVRGLAVSVTTSANWIGNFTIAQLTPIIIGAFHIFGTFYILAFVLLISFFFVLLVVPETKGESLEKMDMLFAKPWLQRIDLLYYLRLGCPWKRSKCRRDLYSLDNDSPLVLENTDIEETESLIRSTEKEQSESELVSESKKH